MRADVLTLLRNDHRKFESLFSEIGRQCDICESGHPPATSDLRAIANFLRNHALPPHHAAEDAIFVMLLVNFPRIRDIYDLADDHRDSSREFNAFSKAVLSDTESFVDAARSYIGNERAHFIAEEEVFFPYAEKYLSAGQRDSVAQILEAESRQIPLDPVIVRICEGA